MQFRGHFRLSLTMQGHLQTAGAEYDTATGETVSLYLSMFIINKKGERTPSCRSPTLILKDFVFMIAELTPASV